MKKRYVDNNWMAEAKKPRPVHCYNIYTGEDYGVRPMNPAELAQFKGQPRIKPVFERVECASPIIDPSDEGLKGFSYQN